LYSLFPGKENGSLLGCTHWKTDINKNVYLRWKVSASILTIRAGSRKTSYGEACVNTIVEGKTKKVTISRESPTVIIGERINPTGKARLAAALKESNFDYIIQEAIAQVEAGAHIIDINVGAPGLKEEEILPQTVRKVAEEIDVPLCIDSSNPAAIEAALEICPGRPLINSTTGEEKSLAVILPLAAKYQVPVIGLTMDEEGIPKDVDTRFSIAKKIVERATNSGIEKKNVLIDVLVMPVGADHQTAKVSFDTARRVSQELGVNIVVGASNVSHGLPERKIINAAFLAMGGICGITAYITDPTVVDLHKAILAGDLLLGKDEWASNFIAFYRKFKSV
jgi:5-methyltetrahydrofolate--homocysteine methyltransferase